MANVTKANFNTRFSSQEDLEQDIAKLIEKYDGQISLEQEFIDIARAVYEQNEDMQNPTLKPPESE